jgi:hypothetical protein
MLDLEGVLAPFGALFLRLIAAVLGGLLMLYLVIPIIIATIITLPIAILLYLFGQTAFITPVFVLVALFTTLFYTAAKKE